MFSRQKKKNFRPVTIKNNIRTREKILGYIVSVLSEDRLEKDGKKMYNQLLEV